MTMTPAARVRAAIPATFAVHVGQSLLALISAWPLARAVERALASHPRGVAALDAPGGLWRLETLAAIGEALLPLADVTLVALLLALALAPLLQMTWLAALLRRMPLRDALGLGARSYAAALGVTVALLPALVLALASLVLVPAALARLMEGSASDRAHDLAVVTGIAPGLLLLAVWALWHDLARASLARGGRPLPALLRGAIACTRPSALPAYLLWLGIGTTLACLTQLLGAILDGGGTVTVASTLILTQLLGLARTFVRGRWLAAALDRVR